VIPQGDSTERHVTLGVYDKGLASAHAFGQARHQLFSTVYWHHTCRIAKAMLQYATALGLPLEVFGPSTIERDRKELEIRERLLHFVKSLVPPFDIPKTPPARHSAGATSAMDLAAEPREHVVTMVRDGTGNGTLNDDASGLDEWYPGIAWTDWLMLKWIGDLPRASTQSGNLIRGLQGRQLYKRVAAYARGGAHQNLITQLDSLGWAERVDLCRKLHGRISDRLQRDWANLNTQTTLTQSSFAKLREDHLLVLIDIPNPLKKVGYYRPLGVVPELKEKSYQQDARQASEDNGWRDVMSSMMEGIAPVRILCHQAVRNLVSAVFSPIETSMAKELSNLLNLP